MAITLAVDAMGGDFGPRVTIPATLVILKNSPQLSVIFVGQESQIQPHLKNLSTDISTRISIVHTDEIT